MSLFPDRTLRPGRRACGLCLVALALAAAHPAYPDRPARTGQTAEEASPPRLTLAEALATAAVRSPLVASRSAEVAETAGDLRTARTYPANPELELEAGGRDAAAGSTLDRGVAVSQQLELAGQRGRRTAAARASLEAARHRLSRTRRLLKARVETAFAEALRARELAVIAAADQALTGRLLEHQQRRLEAGAGTEIDLNLARAAAGRAVRRFYLANAAYAEAQSSLAEVVGLSPADPPEPVGALPDPAAEAPPLPPLDELLAAAKTRRADLAALASEIEAAQARVRLERARAVPDLGLQAFAQREEGTTDIVGLGISVPLPLFNRNQGAIARARAAASRSEAEMRGGELRLARQVAAAYHRYQAAVAAAGALRDLVVGNLGDNLDLLERALEAGKVSAAEVLVVRRELVDGRRELVDALTDAWISRAELELAAGGPLSTPSQEETTP